MECPICGLRSPGPVCLNPGCQSNQGQFVCALCGTLSPGNACANPACAGYVGNPFPGRWRQRLTANQYGGLDWGQLLAVLDRAVLAHMADYGQIRPYIVRQPAQTPSGFHFSIYSPCRAHWLWLCRDKTGAVLNWLPATIQLRPHGFVIYVELRNGNDARVHFPEGFAERTDWRYFEIGRVFRQIGRDQEVALEILDRVRGLFTRSFGRRVDAVIDSMIVLLFGVESARNWATCATSLMLLELIAYGGRYGRRGKPYTFAKAFHHATKMWDTNTFYGGKHPMATHATGAGNLVDRGQIVRAQGVGWEDAVVNDPQHHAVIYRELSILRHWLQLLDWLQVNVHLGVEDRILALLATYLA